MGALDIVLFNDVQNIMQMYSVKGSVPSKHSNIITWTEKMMSNPVIKNRHEEMLAILSAKDLKKDFIQ